MNSSQTSTPTENDPKHCRACGEKLEPDVVRRLCPGCAMRGALEEPAAEDAAPLDLDIILLPEQRSAIHSAASTESLFVGDYVLDKKLGEGGMGIVYCAHHREHKQHMIALKMITGPPASDPTNFLARFAIETNAIAALNHDNIVRIYHASVHEGRPYFTMQYVKGNDLRREIHGFKQRGVRFPLRRGVALVASIARAVHHAHERGVLHRDLKPGNILLDAEGRAYVTDFGLAKLLSSPGDPRPGFRPNPGVPDLTELGQGMGSPGYTSPEQAEGRLEELTTASDVFGLGAILYHLISGEAPLPTTSWRTREGWEEYIRLARAGNFTKPSQLNREAGADLDAICARCLEPDPKRRAASAGDVARQLAHWLDGEPLDPGWRRAPLWERSHKWIRRHPVATGLLVSLCVCLLLGAGLLHNRQRIREETEHRLLTAANIHIAPDNASEGLADFAQLLRQRSDQRIAAERIVNILRHRIFLLPTSINTNTMTATRLSQGRFVDGEISPDGTLRVLGTGTNWITVQESRSGRNVWILPAAHELVIRDLRWSADGRHFVSAGADSKAIIWDVANRTNLPPFEHAKTVNAAELSPSGFVLLTASRDKAASLWNVANRSLIGPPMRHPASVSSARFSPDGRLVVTVCEDAAVRLWDAQTCALVSEPLRLADYPDDARFTPDGRHIEVAFVGGQTRIFKIGQPSTWKPPFTEADSQPPATTAEARGVQARIIGNSVELQHFRTGKTFVLGHETLVNCVRFSPDGQRLATSTAGQRARVWDSGTGQPLTDWLDGSDSVPSVWFSEDGSWLLSQSGSWEIHMASGAAPQWLADLAEAIAGERVGDLRVSGPAGAIALDRVRSTVAFLKPTSRLITWTKEYLSDDPASTPP